MPAQQAATAGHATLLKQKMLTAILRRLDAILFDKLTHGGLHCASVLYPLDATSRPS